MRGDKLGTKSAVPVRPQNFAEIVYSAEVVRMGIHM